LKTLAEPGQSVTIHSAGFPPCLGRIVSVDTDAGSFVFEATRELADAGELQIVASVQGIKLQFSCMRLADPALGAWRAATLPVALVRLQRRRSVRIETPFGRAFRANFKIAGQEFEFDVDDMGMGGVALRATPREATMLFVGKKLLRVQIELGNDEMMMVDLEVRSRRVWKSYLAGEQVLIGCVFVALQPDVQAQLQRTLDRVLEERRTSR
jgi:c-di-GMP-binding flagellar brake protein YcgR